MNRIKRNLIPFGILGMLVLVSLACGELNINIGTPVAEEIETVTVTPAVELFTPTPPSGTDWFSFANRADVQLPEALAGLFYRSDDTLYLVDGKGVPIEAASQIYVAALSPDLSRLAFASNEEDLFVRDLNTGEVTQLTDTPDTLERGVEWWPSRPGVLVFNHMPEESLGPWAGFLGAYDFQSGEIRTLDTVSDSYNGFAVSPDGQAILYDDAGEPIIYTWGGGVTKLNLQSHDFIYQNYHAPTWSPDGSKVAFMAIGYDENSTSGASQAAIVIYRLSDGQVELRHEYELYGLRGEPQMTWSPDGNYLAVTTPGDASIASGPVSLWIISMLGEDDRFLGYSTDPIWSPDGRYLIYIHWPDFGTEQGSYQQDAHVTFLETGVWNPQEVPELLGSSLMAWHQIP